MSEPPDRRRVLPVRVADVPLQQRRDAVREYDFVNPSERMLLFGLALNPGELTAWIAPPAPVFTNRTANHAMRQREAARMIRDEFEM